MQVQAEGSVEVVALEPRFAQTGDGAGVEVGAETAAKAPGALGTRVVSGSTGSPRSAVMGARVDAASRHASARVTGAGDPAWLRARAEQVVVRGVR